MLFHFLKCNRMFQGRIPYQIRMAANVSTADELTGFFNKGFPRNASPPAPSSTAKFAFQPLLLDDQLDILN